MVRERRGILRVFFKVKGDIQSGFFLKEEEKEWKKRNVSGEKMEVDGYGDGYGVGLGEKRIQFVCILCEWGFLVV